MEKEGNGCSSTGRLMHARGEAQLRGPKAGGRVPTQPGCCCSPEAMFLFLKRKFLGSTLKDAAAWLNSPP